MRARGARFAARIVLCLHDELLVHVPIEHSDAVARLLDDCLQEAGHRWAPDDSVRFVADIGVFERWSDAKQGFQIGVVQEQLIDRGSKANFDRRVFLNVSVCSPMTVARLSDW